MLSATINKLINSYLPFSIFAFSMTTLFRTLLQLRVGRLSSYNGVQVISRLHWLMIYSSVNCNVWHRPLSAQPLYHFFCCAESEN